ncbi:MAG: hypothetical protein E7321_02255 [Clostridiales bacterium]|nr:hypothetical protein [Clostridiales bacterium]
MLMLFGRRKPGFAKEVELKPEDISNEFSDRNDPARQDQNPKFEKEEMAAAANAVIDGTAQSAIQPSKDAPVDVFEYMDSLPEVHDPFEPSEDPMIEDPTLGPDYTQLKEGEILANYIRERTMSVNLTPRKELEAEDPTIADTIEEMLSLESCQDIRIVKGQKDEYFYSFSYMAKNYAMIAMLVYEKDIPHTIAHMVRFNCKTYPAPSPVEYFTRHPFSYTKPQLDHAIRMIQQNEAYKDIKVLTTWNGHQYLYSEDVMTKKYAQVLADDAETSEADRR